MRDPFDVFDAFRVMCDVKSFDAVFSVVVDVEVFGLVDDDDSFAV